MPKGIKKNDELELDFGKDGEREFSGSDANPIDNATGETLFDELSPRFVRQIEKAAEKETAAMRRGKPAVEDEDLDPTDEDEDRDPSDEDDEREDEDRDPSDEDEDADPADEDRDPSDEEDEDADEPTPGKRGTKVSKDAFDKRLERANRIIDETRAQVADLLQRDAEREQKDKLNASTQEFEKDKADIEKKLKGLKAQKVTALDDGNTAAQIEIDDQIAELRGQLISKTNTYETAKKEIETATKRKRVSVTTLTKVNQWKRKNPRYESDADFRDATNKIDDELVRSGSNPESDEHYAEIDRRLRKNFPARQKTPPARRHPSAQVSREGTPSQRRPANVRGDEGKVAVRGNKIKISPTKLARVKRNMERFGMDPNDKGALKDYITNNPGI